MTKKSRSTHDSNTRAKRPRGHFIRHLKIGLLSSLGISSFVILGVCLAWMFALQEGAESLRRKIDGSKERIYGEVVDESGPVAAARVRPKGHPEMTLTDELGRFVLPRIEGSDVVTAWKSGYFIGGIDVSRGRQRITIHRLPDEDNASYAWVSPHPDVDGEHNCANCHEQIYREWSLSGHAESARNRRFLNLYDGRDWHGQEGQGWSLLEENPHGAGVCAACHVPATTADDPAQDDVRLVHGVAAEGIHCDFCHKVRDAPTDGVGITHGRYGWSFLRPAKGQLFLGPLDDVDRGEDTYASLYRESRYCAACHEGVIFGVPVYTTYSEWLESPARKRGKQCQSCHMQPSGLMTNIAPGVGGIPRDPQTLATHDFPGGQATMLKRCLDVDVVLTSYDDRLEADVTVRADQVGHRVPTGFIDRHLLLIVDAQDQNGSTVALIDGPRLSQVGDPSLTGRPGRLYAKLLVDLSGKSPIPFWRDHGDLTDTRLSPGQRDDVRFVFPKSALRVRVRLLYRRFWREVADAKRWPSNEVTVVDRLLFAAQNASAGNTSP